MPEGPEARAADAGPAPSEPIDDDAPFFRTLVEHARHMVLVFDEIGTVTYVSPAVGPLVGTTPASALGTNIIDYVAPDELQRIGAALAHKLAHPDAPFRPLEVHFKGHAPGRSSEIVGRPATDAMHEGIAVLIRDTTRRSMVQDIIDSVMRSEPIDHTLITIARLASEHLRLGGVTIAYDAEPGGFRSIVATGISDGLTERCRRLGADTPWDVGVRTGEVVIRGHDELSPELQAAATDAGFRSCWSAPLRIGAGPAVGCLTLWPADDITAAPTERTFLAKLARTAAFAVDRWARDQAMAHAAAHDPLTGAYNRSRFVDHLIAARGAGSAELRSRDDAAESAGNVLLSIDLDGFKTVNDRHGHLAGDQVLVAVTERIRRCVREGDVVARMGGDEFAVLCPGIDNAEEASRTAERIIESLQEPVPTGDALVSVGASVGIAFDDDPTGEGADDDALWLDSLFGRADSALYAAKAAGRGCWELAERAASVR